MKKIFLIISVMFCVLAVNAQTSIILTENFDGSMPKGFARLMSASKLIDRGLDLSHDASADYPFLVQPIFGTARDLGPYEFNDGATGIVPQMIFLPKGNMSLKATRDAVTFTTANGGNADIAICSVSGAIV